MSPKRIRALALSIDGEIDCAMYSLVWKENPDVIENLNNARELLQCVLEQLGDPDDPDELDF